jgi:hypothetical protein
MDDLRVATRARPSAATALSMALKKKNTKESREYWYLRGEDEAGEHMERGE